MEPLVHSEDDRALVEAQLGRPLRGDWQVAKSCHLGIPMVIENHPVLEDGAPFPTLFWLTCPILTKRVSKLEAEGRMRELSAVVAADQDLRARTGRAVEGYRARRDARSVVPDGGSPPGGGPERIKCLHAHVAHELADPPNPIGALVLAQTGWPDCRVGCVNARV